MRQGFIVKILINFECGGSFECFELSTVMDAFPILFEPIAMEQHCVLFLINGHLNNF
jgi:hypothetical protein